MERIETKVYINVLGSNNGQKVRRGIKPGLLVREADGVLYLFTHNRALNNCNYSGNRKGGGACCPLLGGGAKCKNRPNKANKPLLSLFCSLDSQSINQKAKHRYKANKPPKITNHYENKNQ